MNILVTICSGISIYTHIDTSAMLLFMNIFTKMYMFLEKEVNLFPPFLTISLGIHVNKL